MSSWSAPHESLHRPPCSSSICRTTSCTPTAPMRAAARANAEIAGAAGAAAAAGRCRAGRRVLVVATLFTLVPGRGGEPIVSPHLKTLRPFLAKGDFAPGSWGQQLVDRTGPGRYHRREDRLFGLLHDAAGMGAAQMRYGPALLSAASSRTAALPRRCAMRTCARSSAPCWTMAVQRFRRRCTGRRSKGCVRLRASRPSPR